MTKFNGIARRSVLGVVGALVLAAPSAAQAATSYYVSPTGSDGAHGSIVDPFQTIGKAAGIATQGDTVIVEPGRYAETVALGASDSGVTFEGSGTTRPIVDGGGTRQYGFQNLGANNATIQNFEITGQTDAGIYTQGLGDVISGNVVHHVGSPAVIGSTGIRVVWGGSDRVSGNTIYAIGPGGESIGIWLVQTRNATIDSNSVYLVRKEGIRDWQGLDNTITGNRLFLNWCGLAFNMSTGTVATNNYIYNNVEGFDAKHTSYPTVLAYWSLTAPHWSRFWHNTVYGSTETSIWIAQSDQPLDYLDVEDNIFDDAGTALVRDIPTLRGPHVVVDGNAYVFPSATNRPSWIYKAGWTSGGGLTDWPTYVSTLGWEAHGLALPTLTLNNPAQGNLDYPSNSTAAAGSINLGDSFGKQLGARGLAPAPVWWTQYPMTAIDSSSKGTWWTLHHLQDSADNNQNSYWMTTTPTNEYVTYDFGQPRTFDHLILTLYAQFDIRSPHGYVFDVSNDLAHWTTISTGQNPDDEASSYKYELPAPVTARYLRFTMVDTSCSTYTPRTNCGAYFVLSDLAAGLLTPAGTAAPSLATGSQTPSVSAAALLASSDAVELPLACPRAGAGKRCRGTITVGLPTSALRHSKRHHRRHGSVTVIARRAFDIGAGRRHVLRIRVTNDIATRLRWRAVKSVRVTLAAPGASGAGSVVTVPALPSA